MAINSQDNNMLNEVIRLGPDQHLCFNNLSHRFETIKKTEKNPLNVTSNLRELDSTIRKIYHEVDFYSLNPNQILNFMTNLGRVNQIYDNYNARLSQHCFLNFLDKLILIVTFGLKRLKYQYISINDLEEQAGFFQLSIDRIFFNLVDHFSNNKEQIKKFQFLAKKLLKTPFGYKQFGDTEKKQFLFIANNIDRGLSKIVATWKDSPRMVIELNQHILTNPTHVTPQLQKHLQGIYSEIDIGTLRIDQREKVIQIADQIKEGGQTSPHFTKESSILSMLSHLASHPKTMREKLKLTTILFTSGLKLFEKMSAVTQKSFISSIESLITEGFIIPWDKFTSNHRSIFLKFFVEIHKKTKTISVLGNALFQECLKNYDTLTPEEKSSTLYLLLWLDVSLNVTRNILFDLVDYLAPNKFLNHQYQLEVNKIFEHVRKITDLTDAERNSLIALINGIDFMVFQNNGKLLQTSLGLKNTMDLIERLDNLPRLATEYSIAAVQLCYLAATQKMAKEKIEVIENTLEKLNVSRIGGDSKESSQKQSLHSEYFKALTSEKSALYPIFKNDPDRYLAKANEAQLEIYYEPLEKHLRVNLQHLRIGVSQEVKLVPPLPEGVVVNIDELITLFYKLNFNNPQKPNYIHPNTLLDDGRQVTSEELLTGLNRFINGIKARKVSYMPNPDTDPEGFERYWTNIDRSVQHSILKLRNRPIDKCSGPLIWLGGAGLHCGGKLITVSYDLYCQLTDTEYVLAEDTPTGGIIKMLKPRLHSILKNRINLITDEVHSIAAAMKDVGKRLNLKEADIFQYNDSYTGRYFATKGERDTLYKQCLKDYGPTVIINEVVKNLDGLMGQAGTVQYLYRITLEDWFVENMPSEKRKKYRENPEEFKAEIYQMEHGRFRREWVIYLLQELDILERPLSKWNPMHWYRRFMS
jgi:hypothetical protein